MVLAPEYLSMHYGHMCTTVKRSFSRVSILVALVALAACGCKSRGVEISVFYASSLSAVLGDAVEVFHKESHQVRIRLEPSGSQVAARKVRISPGQSRALQSVRRTSDGIEEPCPARCALTWVTAQPSACNRRSQCRLGCREARARGRRFRLHQAIATRSRSMRSGHLLRVRSWNRRMRQR